MPGGAIGSGASRAVVLLPGGAAELALKAAKARIL
jgi:hypothetical protein